MACNISNLACHTRIASIDLTNFYKRHSIPNHAMSLNKKTYQKYMKKKICDKRDV